MIKNATRMTTLFAVKEICTGRIVAVNLVIKLKNVTADVILIFQAANCLVTARRNAPARCADPTDVGELALQDAVLARPATEGRVVLI
jgi:hypothetical protein